MNVEESLGFLLGDRGFLRDFFDNTDCYGAAHVSNGEATKLRNLRVGLNGQRSEWSYLNQCCIPRLEEIGLLLCYLTRACIDLLHQLTDRG